MVSPRLRLLVPAALAFLLTGCLPFSCNRVEPNALAPADSLSRVMAKTAKVDTLRHQQTLDLGSLKYPRSLEFGADGVLWIADSGAHTLIEVGQDGEHQDHDLDSLQYPYMAGFRGQDPVVFSPALHRLAAMRDGQVTWSVQTPVESSMRALQYAVMRDSVIWVKLAGQDVAGSLQRLDSLGTTQERIALSEPYWRWAGGLKMTDRGLLSLSGYRPVVYFPSPDGRIDSTALAGFDSPMLARSFAFMLGQIDQPPLLSPSATWFEGHLFVLNVRPGWLQVDEFDGEFRLIRSLIEESPAFGQDFYPTDLSLFREASGQTVMAVAVVDPRPEVRLYSVPAAR